MNPAFEALTVTLAWDWRLSVRAAAAGDSEVRAAAAARTE